MVIALSTLDDSYIIRLDADVKDFVDKCCRPLYIGGMPKIAPIGIRLSADERAALDAAARSDDRSISSLARRIIAEWLRTNGFLRAE